MTSATTLALPLVFTLVYFSPHTALPRWEQLQLATTLSLFAAWCGCLASLATPTAAETAQRLARMRDAVARGGVGGLTEAWYSTSAAVLSSGTTVAAVAVGAALLAALHRLQPESIATAIYAPLQAAWARLLAAHDPHTLFVAGTIGVHLAIFWPISLLSALLEFWRPAALEPYKVQQSFRLTLPAFLKACAVCVGNEVLLYFCVEAMYKWYPLLSETAFSPELPSFAALALPLLSCIPLSEVLFYAGHRILHIPWMCAAAAQFRRNSAGASAQFGGGSSAIRRGRRRNSPARSPPLTRAQV